MRSTTLIAIPFFALALGTACTEPTEEGATTEARPAIEPIPITTESTAARADFEAGRAKMDVGRALEAREFFHAAVEKDPGFSRGYLALANAAFSTLEFKENLDLALDHAAGKSEGERLLIEIYRTFLTNDADERLQLARRLTDAYPASPRAWLTLGYIHRSRNEIDAARKAMDRAIELDPELLAARFGLWESYIFSDPKDFDRAREEMEACLELAPDEAQIYQNLGDTYRAAKDLEKARHYYGQAIDRDTDGPVGAVASLKKGHINSFLGNYDEARADYDAGLAGSAAPNKGYYANYRAFTHLHADDPRGALDELAELYDAIDASALPEDQKLGAKSFTLTNAAQIALHHDMLEDSERLLAERARVVRANEEALDDADVTRQLEAEILLWEGQLAARAGDFANALAKAEEHRSLLEADSNPRRFEAYHGLRGLADLLQGNYADAIGHFEQSDLTVMYVKYHLALAHEGAGNADQARALFKEVAEWNFNSVGFALVRREALAKAG